jgi:hypothetical protein
MTTTGGAGGGVVQAASANATAVSERGKLRRIEDIRIVMWVLILEACVAFFLLVFIVWWTMYLGPKPPAQEAEKLAAPEKDGKDGAPPAQ